MTRPRARAPSPAAAVEGTAPVPVGVRVVLDDRAVVFDGGRGVLGGDPWRVVRLAPAGAQVLARWRSGAPVGGGRAERRLAARLVAAGLLHPAPRRDPLRVDDLTVVVPVRDRPEALAAALAALAATGPVPGVVVVDDGSAPAAAARTAALAARAGARLVRGRGEGAAAARNLGAAHATTPLVVFLDSDCRPRPGWLAPLLGHLDDPAVGAVAPRVIAAPGGSAAQRYEAARSPLDMGPHPGVVRPLGRVPYVPSAALAVRRAAFPGFDPAMPIGEDVDLVWRIRAAGWTVRHEPAAAVVHDHRRDLRGLLARRVVYGTSVAGLWVRHPGAVPPLVLAPAQALVWGVVAAGVPGIAVGAAATTTARAVSALRRAGVPPPLAARVILRARAAEADLVAGAVTGWWAPALLAAAVLGPLAPRPVRALGASIAGRAARLLAAAALTRAAVAGIRARPGIDPLRWLALCTLDDGANALGVWLGCLRHRTVAPLLPGLRPR